MKSEKIITLIAGGEGLRVEFKECKTALFKGIFDTVAAAGKIATPQATPPQVEKLLEFCRQSRNREEMQGFLGLRNRKYFLAEILKPLLKNGLLIPTIPGKPTSPRQRYYSAKKGRSKVRKGSFRVLTES